MSTSLDNHCTIRTYSASESKALGMDLGKELIPGDVVALTGSLGAGKTVFVQGVAEALGIHEPVTSPTFTLISEYHGRMPLYHMDLYRLGSVEEFIWLGVEEILDGSGVTLIEWSERAKDVLPHRSIYIHIEIEENGDRLIHIDKSRET